MFNLLNFNNDEINENLKQGNLLLNNNKQLLKKNKKNMKLISITSSPHLGYINNLEGMSNVDSNSNSSNKDSNSSINYENIKENSKINLDSNYLQYVIWLLLSFFLILLTFHTFNSKEQSIFFQIILGSIIIIILYQLVAYIRNEYF